MIDLLLATKFHPPRQLAKLVERSRLLELLDAGQGQKLTLLHAPSGFGKTTLVVQWMKERKKSAAWLALDDGDNDPVRFWSALITALQYLHTDIGQSAMVYLSQRSFSSASLETTLTLLINDVNRLVQEGILVLEDYHLINHAHIHEGLMFLIEHLPVSLHIILLTQSIPPLPLVRWRARGDVMDIPYTQLRFSMEETALFLRHRLPQTLSTQAVLSLQTHLGGWVAGLHLFVLSIQQQVSPPAIESVLLHLDADSATDRTHHSLQEFFLSEILHKQPEELQLFLWQTSRLSRMTGALCDAVTGRRDSAEMLDLLERSGFFVEALDAQGIWYRYHPFFAEIIRGEAQRRLDEAVLRDLELRASVWYVERGQLVEAIEAALAASAFERVALLVERLNEHSYFAEHYTLRRWLEQMPDAFLDASPTLCFLLAQARIFSSSFHGSTWRIEAGEELLQRAADAWREQGELHQLGVLYAFCATFTIIHGQIAAGAEYARQALQLLPAKEEYVQLYLHKRPAEWIEWYCGCLMALAWEATHKGAIDAAYHYLLDATMLSGNVKDRVFARVIERMLGDVCVEMGALQQGYAYYQQALEEPVIADTEAEHILRAGSIAGLLRVYYEWNRLDDCARLIEEVSSYRYSGKFSVGEEQVQVKVELVRLLWLYQRGEVAEVHALLRSLAVRLQSTVVTQPFLPDVLALQARLQLREHDVVAAAKTLGLFTDVAQSLLPAQQAILQMLQVRLLLVKGEPQDALVALQALISVAEQGNYMLLALECQVLMALVYATLKQNHEARKQLVIVLTPARSEGFIRLFIDEGEAMAVLLRSLLPTLTDKPMREYVQTILLAFPKFILSSTSTREAYSDELLEPLSPQEKRVLRLLVAGRSNPEIASELVVSANTIKGHVKNIFRKLNVMNRVEAAEVARRLRLL